MNTIIWKGVPSTTVDGLLICELPPISKPPLRVKETMIDGRDGSIIEELGYSSYDKSITIGLRGSFDIDRVIKYFSGEGEIIFSNESEKVYTAKVVNQIDYNRLIRFRTAVVTFRVQPFKHKYNEAYKEAQTATATGTNIVLNDVGSANIRAVSLTTGRTSGNVEIETTGKNLLPFPYYQGTSTSNGVSYTVNDDGSVNAKGTAETYVSVFVLAKELELLDGVAYVLSGEGTHAKLYISYDDGSGETKYANRIVWSKAYKLNKIYIQVFIGENANEVVYPMLEYGQVGTAYEPYQNSKATYAYATRTLSDELQTFDTSTTITNADGVPMTVEYFKTFEVFNEGLETSKPIMVLRGTGTVEISVNGIHIFDYTFPEGESEVVIDSEKEDAYLGTVLKNRNMNGEFPVLVAGTNIIGWSGAVESIEVLPRSRWL